MKSYLSPISEIIKDLSNGKMVVIVDDEKRENEGDLIFSASHVSPQKINFMAKYARGLICLALDKRRFEKLNLKLMTDNKPFSIWFKQSNIIEPNIVNIVRYTFSFFT